MKRMFLIMLAVLSIHNAYAQGLKEPKSYDCMDVLEMIPQLMDKMPNECENMSKYFDNILAKCETNWKQSGINIGTELLNVKQALIGFCLVTTRKDWKGNTFQQAKQQVSADRSSFKMALEEYGAACVKIQKKK